LPLKNTGAPSQEEGFGLVSAETGAHLTEL